MRYRRIRWLLALLLSTIVCHAQTAIELTNNGDGTWTLASMSDYNVQIAVEYEDDFSQAVNLTDNGDGTWTLASMPDYNVRMVVEYEDDLSQAIDLTDNGDGTWTLASMPNYNVRMVVEYEENTNINYNLWIAGIQVTSQNKGDVLDSGKVSYDPSTNALTLNNANISAEGTQGIRSVSANFNINLIGRNNVEVVDGSGISATNRDGGTVTISGGGSLNIKASDVGIASNCNIILQDGVQIKTESTGSFGMEGSRARGARFYPSLKMLGSETILMAKGNTGAITHFTNLNLNDGIKILEPAGTTYEQNNGILITNEWVMIANQAYIDGISLTPALSKDEGEWYDLQGRKVTNPQKGIYIKDGRKIIVK